MKIFERFMKKDYKFLIKEENLLEVIKMIQNSLNEDEEMIMKKFDFKLIFNDEDYMELMEVDFNTSQWCSLLKECKNNNYKLIVNKIVDDKCDEENSEAYYCFKKESE